MLRSSASCAATSPDRAGRTTSAAGRRQAVSCPRGCASPTGSPNRSSRRRPRPWKATTRTSMPRPRPSSSARNGSARSSAPRSSSTATPPTTRRERGIVIADTKFEFGLDADGTLVLADEVLTPDSSRFWPADEYAPGGPQPSFDKQYVRDYCETLGWDKTAPGPELPAGDRRRHPSTLRRGVRADHGPRVRRLPRRPGGVSA